MLPSVPGDGMFPPVFLLDAAPIELEVPPPIVSDRLLGQHGRLTTSRFDWLKPPHCDSVRCPDLKPTS